MPNSSGRPDQEETFRIIAEIPVHAVSRMTTLDYQRRVSEILRLFEIDATGDETGVYYGAAGAQEQDQPLIFAIRSLVARRFGTPDSM